MLSTLAVPEAVDRLGQLVEEHWHILEKTTDQPQIDLLRRIGQLERFAHYSDAEIWAKVEWKKSASETQEDAPLPSLKVPEWNVLSNPAVAPSARDFKVMPVAPPTGYEELFKQVVLVERLREVRALVGFTRIEAPGDFTDIAELPEVRRAPLSRKRPM